jgi:penicillin amidase
MFSRLLGIPASGAGASNEWVVDGTRSATGKPILANDPHLELNIPILWYLVRIVTPELTLTGATAPGGPLVLLGQNGHIAWGFTTTDSDTQDLFVEKPAPGGAGRYLTPDGPMPIRSQAVTIKVKGEAPVQMTRRLTRHGPVISDAAPEAGSFPPGEENAMVSLAWTGLDENDTTAEAFFRLTKARNREEFLAALRLYRSPAQNIVYADREGNIGFVNAGAVPVRKSGDGRYPADGASGEADWSGIVPFEGWPQVFNPLAGAIVNANNAVTGPDHPHWFGRDQSAPYRAMRIIELLGEKHSFDLDGMAAIQMDIKAAHAPELMPYLLKLEAGTPLERQALGLLKNWDFMARRDRPEALIFDWWLRRMNEALLKSGLDPVASVSGGLNASVVVSILRRPDGFCGAGDAGLDCMKAVKTAFSRTLDELSRRYGPDASKWRLGDEHVALMENQVLDNIPGFRALFGASLPSDGGFYSVNRGGGLGKPDEAHPLQRNSGAGFRGLYDLADPSRSRFVIATGQSGHPLSPFYADQLRLYQAGSGIALMMSREALEAESSGKLIFKP